MSVCPQRTKRSLYSPALKHITIKKRMSKKHFVPPLREHLGSIYGIRGFYSEISNLPETNAITIFVNLNLIFLSGIPHSKCSSVCVCVLNDSVQRCVRVHSFCSTQDVLALLRVRAGATSFNISQYNNARTRSHSTE